jgi:hypothetical protein
MRDVKPANPHQAGQTIQSGSAAFRPSDQATAGQHLDCVRRRQNQRHRRRAAGLRTRGLSFDIADLSRAQGWAIVHDWRLRIRLDHGADGEEYEEVIELQSSLRPHLKTILWRDARAVFVQPLPGKRQRHRSMQEALESLHASRRSVVVSDFVATAWPTNPA